MSDRERVAEQVCAWLLSEEGQRTLRESLARVQELAREFSEASRVDWRDPFLYQPLDAARRLREGWG